MNNCELTGRVAAVAAVLTQLGVRHEERVLILMPDGAGFIDTFVAALERGAVPLPVNPALSDDDVMAVAADAGVRLVVGCTERIDALADRTAHSPVPVDGPAGPWAAALQLD